MSNLFPNSGWDMRLALWFMMEKISVFLLLAAERDAHFVCTPVFHMVIKFA